VAARPPPISPVATDRITSCPEIPIRPH
jgi:hypothetical protein